MGVGAGSKWYGRRNEARLIGHGGAAPRPYEEQAQLPCTEPTMNKRLLAVIALGLSIPSIAFAATVASAVASGCCPLCP